MKRHLQVKGWLSEWLDFAGSAGETPLEYHLATGVCILGAFLSGGERFCIDTGRSPVALTPRISSMLVGDSGTGKSLAIQWGMRLLDRVNEAQPDDRILHNLTHRTTGEYLVHWLSKHPWGFVAADEAAVLLRCQRDYNADFAEILTNLLDDHDRYTFSFLKRQDVIIRPLLSVLAGTNPPWLSRIVTPVLAAGGFPGRWMWWFGEPRPDSEPPIRTAKEWAEIVDRFAAAAATEGRVDFGRHARSPGVAWYKEWRDEHKATEKQRKALVGDDDRVDSWRTRWPTWILRLALVSAASEGRAIVRPEDLEWGKACLEVAAPPYEKAMHELESLGKPDRRDVLRHAIMVRGGSAKCSQLMSSKTIRGYFKRRDDLLAELNDMIVGGMVKAVAGAKEINYVLIHGVEG